MIPFSKPSIRRAEMNAVLSCMVSDSLEHGNEARELVSLASAAMGRSGGLAVREYQRAIDLAFGALNLQPGSVVGMTALIPQAYRRVALLRGLKPVLIDVDPDTALLTPERVAEQHAATPLDALAVRHVFGQRQPLDGFAGLGIPVIEDAGEAVGAEPEDGGRAEFTVVSLEPDKVITAGGGTLVLAGGRSQHRGLRKNAEHLADEQLLPDMNASLGLTQLRKLSELLGRRHEIREYYIRALHTHRTLPYPGPGLAVAYTLPVVLDTDMRSVVEYARKHGVSTRTAFSDTAVALEDGEQPAAEGSVKAARGLLLRCVLFPIYPTLTNAQIQQIGKVLATVP